MTGHTNFVSGDASSKAGTTRLIRTIRDYWLKRGVKVKFSVTTILESQHRPVHCIRSDLGEKI